MAFQAARSESFRPKFLNPPHINWISWMLQLHWMIWDHHPATGWKHCGVIIKVFIVFESTPNGESYSAGRIPVYMT